MPRIVRIAMSDSGASRKEVSPNGHANQAKQFSATEIVLCFFGEPLKTAPTPIKGCVIGAAAAEDSGQNPLLGMIIGGLLDCVLDSVCGSRKKGQ